MDRPSRSANTVNPRYASPPPDAQRPLGDITNRGLGKTPPRKISADRSMELLESPARKRSLEKENSSTENTPERKISDVTNGKSPPRRTSADSFRGLPMPEETEGKSVFGNDGTFVDKKGRSLLPPQGGLDISNVFSDLPKKKCFDELQGSVYVSAAGSIPVKASLGKRIGIPMLSLSALGISKENEVSQDPFISPGKLLELGAELIPEGVAAIDFLSKKGVNVDGCLGKGANGSAYKTTVSDEASASIASAAPMIYKKEKELKLLTDINSKPKFWRHHDPAAARINLPHLAKPIAFLVEVKMQGRKTERFYVPADKIKEFGVLLPTDASVRMEGQLAEKATGKNLAELIKEDENFFHPDGPHFTNIIRAVDEFLRAAHDRNFIHRDLKPANIMYDPASEKVTIIDTGEASRLRRRGKTDEEVKTTTEERRLSNPTGSSSYLGTCCFMAPSIIGAKKYGSEVDFF